MSEITSTRCWSPLSRDCLAQAVGERPACEGCKLIPEYFIPACKMWESVQWLLNNKPEGAVMQRRNDCDRILQVLRESPGLYRSTLLDKVGISHGMLSFHLQNLSFEGRVAWILEGKHKRWYVVEVKQSKAL